MYSLLIAEDELTTRNGLVHMVKWNEIGYRVDGEFSDGQELLEYLKNHMPDVILTDIKMSRVSGLDIAKFVYENHLPVQVVFLSGYKDFEYAQSAVEYRVLHYLVKPVAMPKLRSVFADIKEKLDQQSKLQNALLNRADHYQKLINYQKQQFFTDIWMGKLETEQEIRQRMDFLQVKKDAPQRLFLTRMSSKKNLESQKFLMDYGLSELQEQMISLLRVCDPGLEYYELEWEEPSMDCLFSAVGIFWEKENHVDIQQTTENFQQQLQRLTDIRSELVVLKEIHEPVELLSLKDNLKLENEPKERASFAGIENVMEYIQQHYCEDITLSEIAEHVFLNPIYISRLIKEQTGKNYTDLLMELRIQKAVMLLKTTNLYVYEIAEMVGYHNLKYFYKVFKKVKGKSPNDYREKKEKPS